jgi:dUTP pyrophosphatase
MANFEIGVYKVDPTIPTPTRATEQAACWDIHLSLHGNIKWYNDEGSLNVISTDDLGVTAAGKFVEILPGERFLLPTGIIFSIPPGTSLRIHARSSLAWKHGLMVANGTGIIDSDYFHETFVVIANTGGSPVKLYEHDRIAQIEVLPVPSEEMVTIKETSDLPGPTTNRTGGFGSTGA